MPLFDHWFDPPSSSSLGPQVDLTIREIEDAGLLEILQTPGARLGTWSILNALLDSTKREFVFTDQLGQSREIKTALSGLFGRFVARAYSTRYLGFSYFATIHGDLMPIAPSGGFVRRMQSGDRPDWVAFGSNGLAIIEAKGCHDFGGPGAALARAFEQTGRVRIEVHGRIAPFKRYAIATRWGFSNPWPSRPMLWVQDPDEEGDGMSLKEINEIGLGLARRHSAALLQALGEKELATILYRLSIALPDEEVSLKRRARSILSQIRVRTVDKVASAQPSEEFIGGFVTRNGPLEARDLSAEDRATLARLDLQPTFIGLDREFLNGLIEGRKFSKRAATEARDKREASRSRPGPKTDGAGSWTFRFDEDEGELK